MTVTLPSKLRPLLSAAVREHRYSGASDFCVGLVLWDIYSRQAHARTGPILRDPSWVLDNHVESLLARLRLPSAPGLVKPHRFSVRLPSPIAPLALQRQREEHFRSASAYVVSLIVFALDPDVPALQTVPHHKLAPLLREPRYLREAVIAQLAADFGHPDRTWPDGLEPHLTHLVARQRQLPLR